MPVANDKKPVADDGFLVRRLNILVWGLFGFAALASGVMAYWVFFYIRVRGGFIEDPGVYWAKWGPLGDFIGGTLNPILTFLTFVGVLLTIGLQARELRLTRDEAIRTADALEGQLKEGAKQAFEATFFQMLHLQNEIASSLEMTSTVTDSYGRDEEVETDGRDVFFRAAFDLQMKMRRRRDDKPEETESDRIIAIYNADWRWYRKALAHYFRYLFNTIKLIDEAKVLADPDETVEHEERMRYVRILRAQLSDYELVMLLYNAMGEHGGFFRDYIDRYKLFDNLDDEIIVPFSKAEYVRWDMDAPRPAKN